MPILGLKLVETKCFDQHRGPQIHLLLLSNPQQTAQGGQFHGQDSISMTASQRVRWQGLQWPRLNKGSTWTVYGGENISKQLKKYRKVNHLLMIPSVAATCCYATIEVYRSTYLLFSRYLKPVNNSEWIVSQRGPYRYQTLFVRELLELSTPSNPRGCWGV